MQITDMLPRSITAKYLLQSLRLITTFMLLLALDSSVAALLVPPAIPEMQVLWWTRELLTCRLDDVRKPNGAERMITY